MHLNNVVQRDLNALKPKNVILDNNFYPRIADFGLSKVTSSSNSKGFSTNIGTPLFSAPEQMSSSNYNGKKADVYSFGMMLYSL